MGTMRERAPGTWELVVSAGRDPATGRYRRVIRTVRTTSKREAKAALAQLTTDVAAGRAVADDHTLAQLLEKWLEYIAGLGRAPTTLYHYRQYVDREIVPVPGAIRLSRLTAWTSISCTPGSESARWRRRRSARSTRSCAPR